MTREALARAVRSWFKASAVSGGLADAQVIHGDEPGLRPSGPFAEVRVVVFRNFTGDAERFVTGDAPNTISRVRRLCEDTVSINVYGPDAEEWLSRVVDFLWQESASELLTTAGISIDPLGGMTNLSGLFDDEFERRFQQDFLCRYQYMSDAETMDAAEEIVVATDLPVGTITLP